MDKKNLWLKEEKLFLKNNTEENEREYEEAQRSIKEKVIDFKYPKVCDNTEILTVL